MSTEETTPTTRPGIRDRLNAIAPYPNAGTPDHARAVAKYLAVSAQRRWKYNLDIADMDSDIYRQSVQAMMGEFAALHLLMALIDSDPAAAERLSRKIRDAWDGGEIGPWLWQHATALGIDPDEVSRLEEAWWALPEAAGARKAAGPEEITKLQNACQVMGKIITGNARAMEAARIELAQGSAEKAMQWILNSLPDVPDGDPGDQWNGTETADEWFDRTREGAS
jgi:hypothetical protein